METETFDTALERLDRHDWPSDPGEALAEISRIVAEVNAATTPSLGVSDDLAEKLQEIIAKLYEKLRAIVEDLKHDNDVSFTITVGVPLGVSLTVKPKLAH